MKRPASRSDMSEAPQAPTTETEKKPYRTRRGGKSHKRHKIALERALALIKVQEQQSDDEGDANASQAKQEEAWPSKTISDVDLLQAWASGELAVPPEGVRLSADGRVAVQPKPKSEPTKRPTSREPSRSSSWKPILEFGPSAAERAKSKDVTPATSSKAAAPKKAEAPASTRPAPPSHRPPPPGQASRTVLDTSVERAAAYKTPRGSKHRELAEFVPEEHRRVTLSQGRAFEDKDFIEEAFHEKPSSSSRTSSRSRKQERQLSRDARVPEPREPSLENLPEDSKWRSTIPDQVKLSKSNYLKDLVGIGRTACKAVLLSQEQRLQREQQREQEPEHRSPHSVATELPSSTSSEEPPPKPPPSRRRKVTADAEPLEAHPAQNSLAAAVNRHLGRVAEQEAAEADQRNLQVIEEDDHGYSDEQEERSEIDYDPDDVELVQTLPRPLSLASLDMHHVLDAHDVGRQTADASVAPEWDDVWLALSQAAYLVCVSSATLAWTTCSFATSQNSGSRSGVTGSRRNILGPSNLGISQSCYT